MLYKKRNFWLINAVNAIFFAGYLVLKFPLAYILAHAGIPLTQAYSLTTTCTIAFAICSLSLPFILRHYHNQKHVFLLSIILILMAALLLQQHNYLAELMGLTFYVIGGSFYFFNITLLVNKQLDTPKTRLTGNYLSQILLNIGAFSGCLIFLISAEKTQDYFFYSTGFIGLSFVLLATIYHWINDHTSNKKEKMHLYKNALILFCIVFTCLHFSKITRYVIATIFLITLGYSIRQSRQTRDPGYLLFILSILFFSLPYWISAVVIYNQFFIFLHHSVLSFFYFPATAIILLDPLGNIFFGLLWHRIALYYEPKPYFNLTIGLLFIVIAFGVLWLGLSIQSHPKLTPAYPISSILLFACGQFLIQPTMHARLPDFIKHHQNMVFGLGILRGIRAIAAIIGFYLMNNTVTDNPSLLIHQNGKLYLEISLIALTGLAAFFLFRKLFISTTY